MAIEVNKRKRKHSEHVDEGANIIPKKQQKNSKTPKKEKRKHENGLENGNEYNKNSNKNEFTPSFNDEKMDESWVETPDNHIEKEQPIKFSKDFKMMEFRNKIRGTNFITELRHFLHLLERKPHFVTKYIEKRGKPLELAEALERIDKSNVLQIGYVCQALHAVLMEIVSNQQSQMESAVSACRYFLKVHGAVIEQLLKSSYLKHRRIALKLLTAIVCVDPQMGRQVLAAFSILSDKRNTQYLLSHSKFEFNDDETVRKCYIHFVLAFLVDGNTLLVQNILDRSSLIQALVHGLLYDDHLTVCLVLKTLKKYVLESANISKTKKIHVFDQACCCNLVRLYDWYGPNVYKAMSETKHEVDILSQNKIDTLVDSAEKETVANAVHEFMLILLGSRKHGIAFDAVTHFRQRRNVIQGKVFGAMKKPYANALKTELIVKTLEACPELARNTIRHFTNNLKPNDFKVHDWPLVANFLEKIINVLHPKLLRSVLNKLTLTDLAYWIKEICLPLHTLIGIKQKKFLLNLDFNCRLATQRLILTMYTQYVNYLNTVMQREQSKSSGGSTLRRFKFDLYDHILLNFPSVDVIFSSLHLTTNSAMFLDIESVLEHFHVTLDLILAICKQNRAFIDKTGTILDYLKLIRPLYTGEIDEDESEEEDKLQPQHIHALVNHGDVKLEIKAIKTILMLDSKAIQPGLALFPNVFKSFIKGLTRGSQDIQRESGELLREIFKNTGIFEAGPLEIDLWLEALKFLSEEAIDMATQIFIEVLKVTKAQVDLPIVEELETKEANLNQLFENIEKGHSVQSYVVTFGISKLLPLIYKGVDIIKPFKTYLELVCYLLYHYHPTPAYVVKLYEMQFEKQKPYMLTWLQQETEQFTAPKFPKIAECIPQLKELQTALLNAETNSSFEELFCIDAAQQTTALEIEIKGKELKLMQFLKSERLLMIYIQQVLFVVTELLAKKQLKRTQAEFAATCLEYFFAILNYLEQKTSEEVVHYTDDGVAVKQRNFLNMLLAYVFDVKLGQIGSAQLCLHTNEANSNYLHFLALLAQHCSTLNDFDSIVGNYRLKIVKAVAIGIDNNAGNLQQQQQHGNTEFIEMVEAFQLPAENCLEILEMLCKRLKYNDLFLHNVSDGYQRAFYYDLLVCVLKRLSALGEAVQCADLMKPLSKFYTKLQNETSSDLNLEDFELALHDFLLIAHQYIPLVAKKLFESIFKTERLHKSSVKLAALLLERHNELCETFLKLLPTNLTKRELIYPLLEVVFNKKLQINTALLLTIYQEYRNGFMKSIEKPQKAGVIYKEHANCSIALVEFCMPESECLDFCKKRFQFNDPSEIYQLKLMQAIYEKAFKVTTTTTTKEKENEHESEGEKDTNNTQAKMFINFLHLQIQLLCNDLKRQAMSLEKLEFYAYSIQNWCEKLETTEIKPNFESLIKSQNWSNFCKTCLKLGMQPSENEADIDDFGLLLQLLAYLCEQIYQDYADEVEEIAAEPAQLFQMICTHSKFYEIMLPTKPTKLKTEVLHLLFILAKKSPIQALTHLEIPVLLGAYHAKLNAADRYALALLQLYEQYNAEVLQQYRPLIWGESAISCYALRTSDLNERTRLTQQETSISLVMSLIERHSCEYTIENFPIWRKLNAQAQLPVVKFIKPTNKAFYSFGHNNLERHVELSFNNIKSTVATLDARVCPETAETYEHCYDPAFFVPLMCNCFAPESFVHTARPVQNGLLAMCFVALSSHDKEMRQAAGLVQLRYRAHFEQSKFFEKPLWIQAYENIQAGLADLSESWLDKHKTHSKQYVPVPRVPYIPTLFIAKTFNMTTDPTNLLYKPLTFYLRLKSTFNFQCVPEFNVFFHSPEVEHHTYRQFIIEIIRQGLKSSADIFLLISTNTFKVLLAFYGGPMSNLETNLQLLSLLSNCVKIPAAAKLMIDHVGIIPWLKTVLTTLQFYHFDVIERIIDILSNLWYSITATAAEFYNYNFICLELFNLLVNLLPLLSARINVFQFSRLLNIMQKSANINKTTASPYTAISSEQLDKLIGCAQKHFGALIKPMENLKRLGAIGAASHESYCMQLFAENVEADAIVALSSLRAFIIEWSKCQKVATSGDTEMEASV